MMAPQSASPTNNFHCRCTRQTKQLSRTIDRRVAHRTLPDLGKDYKTKSPMARGIARKCALIIMETQIASGLVQRGFSGSD
jgi:hypothetical protein